MTGSFAASALIKQNVTYLDLVAAAVLVYDYLLTVEREARLVWPVPWNVGKVLFFLTRYTVFADTFMVLYHQFVVLSPAACQELYKTIGYLLGIGTLIAESILAVRTWVIWRCDRRVGAVLITALISFWTPIFYFLSLSLNSLIFANPPQPNMTGCFLFKQNPILWVVFVFVMVFETLILGLTLLKGSEHFRRTPSTLVSVLYLDGILNYIYLCILSIINVVVLLTAPHGYSTLLTATQRVLHSVLSARILLHLREAAVMRSKSTMTHLTSEMGGFSIDRSGLAQARKGSPSAISGKGPKKCIGRGGATYPEFGLEAVPTTVSYSQTATSQDMDLPVEWFERGEVGPEMLFGEKREGELPEIVTWFGDRSRGDAGEVTGAADVELEVSR